MKTMACRRVHELAFGIVICFGNTDTVSSHQRDCLHRCLASLADDTTCISISNRFPRFHLRSSTCMGSSSQLEPSNPSPGRRLRCPAPPPAVNHAAPPPSPGAEIVLLVADCLTQLSSGLIITPATISSESPAAIQVPADQEEDYEAPKVDSATNDEPRCLSEAQKVESFLTGLTYSESFS